MRQDEEFSEAMRRELTRESMVIFLVYQSWGAGLAQIAKADRSRDILRARVDRVNRLRAVFGVPPARPKWSPPPLTPGMTKKKTGRNSLSRPALYWGE